MNNPAHTPADPRRLLVFGFGSIILLLLGLIGMGLLGFGHLIEQFNQAQQQHERTAALASALRHVSQERSLRLYTMALTEDPFERDELFMEVRDQGSAFFSTLEQLEAQPLRQQDQLFLKQLRDKVREVGAHHYRVIELLNQEEFDQARAHMISHAIPGQRQVGRKLDDFAQQQRDLANGVLQQAKQDGQRQIKISLGLCLIGLVVSIGIGQRVSQRISGILRALNHSLSQEQSIRDNIFAAVITANKQGQILSCNKATERIFGRTCQELIGRNLSLLMPEPHAQAHDGYMQRYLHSGERRIIGSGREVEGLHRDGHRVPLQLGVSEIRIDGEPVFIGVLDDISLQKQAEASLIQMNERLEQGVRERTQELEEANRQLSHLARHDLVTGLPNRAMLYEYSNRMINRALREKSLVAMMFLDLDGFKAVNDNLGHDVGDQVLKETGRRIQALVREEDMVARIGGDEFAVICAHLEDLTPVDRIARDIIQAIGKPYACEKNRCNIGVSIGVSLYPSHACNSEELLRLADEAMYQVKHGGKNSYVIYQPKPSDQSQSDQRPGNASCRISQQASGA
jgi:diguanylate cyclase (GGDEF)-like protein/PAS domain S-box-containing protein